MRDFFAEIGKQNPLIEWEFIDSDIHVIVSPCNF